MRLRSAQLASAFFSLIKAGNRLLGNKGSGDARLPDEMFQMAQWALASGAAQSLSQMAARAAKDDAGLSTLVRERQDLVLEWQKRTEMPHWHLVLDASFIPWADLTKIWDRFRPAAAGRAGAVVASAFRRTPHPEEDGREVRLKPDARLGLRRFPE